MLVYHFVDFLSWSNSRSGNDQRHSQAAIEHMLLAHQPVLANRKLMIRRTNDIDIGSVAKPL